MGQSPTFPWRAWDTAQARDSSHVALWTRPLSSGSREKSVFGMPNGSECWVAHSMDVAWPCHPAPVPGNLGIWHCFLCQDRHSHAFHLEPFPYISLSFPIPREDEGRRGVNRMPHWPCSARFTCPVSSELHLFAFPPVVMPVLTGGWAPPHISQVILASLADWSASPQRLI